MADAVNPPVSAVNPLDVQNETAGSDNSSLVKSIINTATNPTGNILDIAPEVDMSLLADVAPPKSILLTFLKIFCVLALLFAVVAFVFFTSQLTTYFDAVTSRFDIPNVSKDFASTNKEILNTQTDLNFYRYLKLKANFDEFSYLGDGFLTNYDVSLSQTASEDEKQTAKEVMENAKPRLREIFLKLKDTFSLDFAAPITVDGVQSALETELLFQTELKSKLTAKASELDGGSDLASKRESRNYTQASELVGKGELKSVVLATDFDVLSDEDLYNLIKQVNSLIINDMSTISAIKENRIKWSDIINEIELRTIAVDSHYNSNDLYQDVGGIRYNSYDFNSENRSISIAGETRRFDTANFSMIANLIDELNRSDFFQDAEMRAFTKSGSLTEGYTANLTLKLNLKGYEDSSSEASESLDEMPEIAEF